MRRIASRRVAIEPVYGADCPPRVIIEHVQPRINEGRFPIKRVIGEEVLVTADIHADGHDRLEAVVRYRSAWDPLWKETPMTSDKNDHWTGRFPIERLSPYEYTVKAWIERSERRNVVTFEPVLKVTVDPVHARFSAWYEMFPRSLGTLREAEKRLPEIADMGFSVVYLPPVHPIGKTLRKGPNNTTHAGPHDPGSPWAIGSEEGGHKAVDPALGTLRDFDHFVEAAGKQGMQVAIDLAYQCSRDHPYLREHPEWFLYRPDGTIQYAENPPKKYEDIIPFHFECAAWQALWKELKSVVEFWVEHGVRIFRVDNPHTKPYRFWEWLIREVQSAHPGTIFLSEAFTRPKIMRYLAKCGFTQSYTYFTWRNTKEELTEYMMELTRSSVADYLQPNFFTNTPDILHAYLQTGGRAAHKVRLVLAATLSASYGIYSPPFELCENRAIPGTEDYQDSEKYQIRSWPEDPPGHIKDFIRKVNMIRRHNPALQTNRPLLFCPTSSDQLIAYLKYTSDFRNVMLVVVNLDPHHVQFGHVDLSLSKIRVKEKTVRVHDLLNEAMYDWQEGPNFVRLDPQVTPAHMFRLIRSDL